MTDKLKVPERVYKSMKKDYERAARRAQTALAEAEAKKQTLDQMEIETSAAPKATTAPAALAA